MQDQITKTKYKIESKMKSKIESTVRFQKRSALFLFSNVVVVVCQKGPARDRPFSEYFV